MMKKYKSFIGLICIWLAMCLGFAIFFPGYLFIKDWFRIDMLVLLLIAIVPMFAGKFVFSYTYMIFLCAGFITECVVSNYYRKLLGHPTSDGMMWNLVLIAIGLVVGICLQIVYSRRKSKQ